MQFEKAINPLLMDSVYTDAWKKTMSEYEIFTLWPFQKLNTCEKRVACGVM